MKKLCILIFLIIAFLTLAIPSKGADNNKEVDSMLVSAESFFKMMKERNYARIWLRLSHASQNSIIDDTYKNIMYHFKAKGKEVTYSKGEIRNNFTTGGTIAQAYWDSYLTVFNPDMVLEYSKWEIGKVGKERAQINIIYRKAERPAVIQMYKEDNVWRVGLTETFRSPKR